VSNPDGLQRSPLRYKRFGGGYRREDVESALAELGLTLRQLGQDLESLRDRNGGLEGELAAARSEIESYRAKENELWQMMSAALRGAVEIEEGATARAQEIVAQAEEEAQRIRSEASRRLEDSSERFNELLRVKDNLLDAMRRVVGDFGQAITRFEQGEQLSPETAPAAPAAPPPPTPLHATPPPVSPPVSPPPLAPAPPAAAEEPVSEFPRAVKPLRP
jgi:DNA anti-recombination protein RmuC